MLVNGQRGRPQGQCHRKRYRRDSLGGHDREQRARRLDQLKLDVVVCNKQLEIIAVAVFSQDETQEPALLDSARFIEECLGSAGIRVIRIDRTALPRHHRVRALVYGRA